MLKIKVGYLNEKDLAMRIRAMQDDGTIYVMGIGPEIEVRCVNRKRAVFSFKGERVKRIDEEGKYYHSHDHYFSLNANSTYRRAEYNKKSGAWSDDLKESNWIDDLAGSSYYFTFYEMVEPDILIKPNHRESLYVMKIREMVEMRRKFDHIESLIEVLHEDIASACSRHVEAKDWFVSAHDLTFNKVSNMHRILYELSEVANRISYVQGFIAAQGEH